MGGFRYEFTPKELWAFLRGKQRCPECNEKMIRNKKHKTVKGRDVNSKADAFFVPQDDIRLYYYEYQCPKCGYTVRLDEERRNV